jgi:enoyl-CoA hydratase/carnithine racemase
LTDGENRLHPEWIDGVHGLLDEVEGAEGNAALVTTSTGKFYSNGLDTDWLFANYERLHWYLDRVHTVYTRLLTLPMPTVAAINGHAFGAGAMLASVHDHRVMRSDRGFWCLPEINLNMTFTVGMNAILATRAAGIVDAVADSESLLEAAVEHAAALAGARGKALGEIKRRLHEPLLAALAVPTTPENLVFGS